MAEDKNTNMDISHDGSSYYRIWKDTGYGTGRIEATSGREQGYRVEARSLYCDCQVGVDSEDNLGGTTSLTPLRGVEPRVLNKGSSRLCDDLPKNGPELDA